MISRVVVLAVLLATVLASVENSLQNLHENDDVTVLEPFATAVDSETALEGALVDSSAGDTINDQSIELHLDGDVNIPAAPTVRRMLQRLHISSEHERVASEVVENCLTTIFIHTSLDDMDLNTLRTCALHLPTQESETLARIAFIEALLSLRTPFNPMEVFVGEQNMYSTILSHWQHSVYLPRILRAIVKNIEAVFGNDSSAYPINNAVESLVAASHHSAVSIFAESALKFDYLGALSFVHSHDSENGSLQMSLLSHVSDEDLRCALCSPWYISAGRKFILAEARRRNMSTVEFRYGLKMVLGYLPKLIKQVVTTSGSLRATADAIMTLPPQSYIFHLLIQFGERLGERFCEFLAIYAATNRHTDFLLQMKRHNMLSDTVLVNALFQLKVWLHVDAMIRLLDVDSAGMFLNGITNYAAMFVAGLLMNREETGVYFAAISTVGGVWGKFIASLNLIISLEPDFNISAPEKVSVYTALAQHLSRYDNIADRFLALTSASHIATHIVGREVSAAGLLAVMLVHHSCPDLRDLSLHAARSGNPMFFEDIHCLSNLTVRHQLTYYRLYCHDLVKGRASNSLTLAAMNWVAEGEDE